MREALAGIEEIAPERARHLLDAGMRDDRGVRWHFLDVREPDEFAAGHIPGARHTPRGVLEVRADLEHHKRDPWFARRDRALILYCGGGNRSALATRTLRDMGFERVLSLAEGWSGWETRHYPIER